MKVVVNDLKLFLILSLLSAAIFVLDNLGLFNFPKGALQIITVPIQYGLYQSGLKIDRQRDILSAIRKSGQENLALQAQLSEVLTENALLRQQLSKTQTLVDEQNSLNPETFVLQSAQVLGFGRYLLINQGSENAVDVGQIVVFKDNYVGKIISVSPKVSEVMLSQDPDSKIAVFSQGDNRKARGILTGQFESGLLMDKILHDETINPGDLVYSEGSSGDIPRGLILGQVSQVMARPNEVFKQAMVEPLFKPEDLDVVFIIKNQ